MTVDFQELARPDTLFKLPEPACHIIIEPSCVDRRWCVDSGDRESLMPAWAVPLAFFFAWRRIQKRRRLRIGTDPQP
jgi:hypothetical protein